MSMRINKEVEANEVRKNGGRLFRLMLRGVKPEHVPGMIQMLWLLGHGGKKLMAPKQGRWVMGMPHGYILVGEGRTGGVIESPRGQVALRVDNPYDGAHFQESRPIPQVPKLDDHDTAGILGLCDQARKANRPERDQVISQIFALNLDRCRPKAIEAIELLTYDLIVNATQ